MAGMSPVNRDWIDPSGVIIPLDKDGMPSIVIPPGMRIRSGSGAGGTTTHDGGDRVKLAPFLMPQGAR